MTSHFTEVDWLEVRELQGVRRFTSNGLAAWNVAAAAAAVSAARRERG